MSGSTGKGRLLHTRRYPTLRGRLGLPDVESSARAVANDTFWGGFPPAPTAIPYEWLTPPARWRSDQPRNVAAITRAGGATARSVNAASVAAVGERPFTATLDSQIADDPANYAAWVTANYTAARQRMPQVRLNLLPRTPTECWRILERQIGDRISVTGSPDPLLASMLDRFGRTGSNGWDVADSGQPWIVDATPASDYFTNGDQGVMTMSVVNSERRIIADLGSATVQNVRTWNQTPSAPAGAPTNWGVLLRWQDPDNYYWVDAQVGTDLSITLRLLKRVNAGLTQVTTVPTGVVHDTSVPRVLVAQVAFSRIRARLHSSDVVDPGVWQLDTLDESLTAGTYVGCVGRLMTGSANVGSTIRFDNFVASTPNPFAWPAGLTDLVIEGVEHSIDSDGTRWVAWNTAPLIGAAAGQAGPWFRADASTTDTGLDLLAF